MASDITNVEDCVSRSAEDSSPSTVQLEIDLDWWWWSGYPRHPRYDPWTLAETDGPGFYDLAAFPSLKPDIDLFGVPHRSRKQRGWYQIVAPLSGQPTPPTETHQSWATALDIPPELFKHILAHLREDKHALARCGQVCRYWARECRRRLFQEVVLRSREEALPLLHFMRDPSDVSRLIHIVWSSSAQKVPSAPWIHLLPLIKDRSRHPKGMENFWVRLSGPLPPGQRSLRSIHHALPRSLPHFSRHIDTLRLKDLHFTKLDDLMHLVWEMPHLIYLECVKVTWGSFPLTPPRRKPLGYYPLKTDLDKGCSPHSVEAAVWLSTSVMTSALSIDDFARVLAIARAIDETATGALASSVFHACGQLRIDLERDLHYLRFSYGHRPQDSAVSPSAHIVVMRFRPLSNANLDTQHAFIWRNLDWAIVGRTLSSFPGLRRVIIGLDTREDMVDFDNIARAHMSRLHGAGVFKYALWDPNEVNRWGNYGTWLRASPDSDETEPSGADEHRLRDVYDTVLPAASQPTR